MSNIPVHRRTFFTYPNPEHFRIGTNFHLHFGIADCVGGGKVMSHYTCQVNTQRQCVKRNSTPVAFVALPQFLVLLVFFVRSAFSSVSLQSTLRFRSEWFALWSRNNCFQLNSLNSFGNLPKKETSIEKSYNKIVN